MAEVDIWELNRLSKEEHIKDFSELIDKIDSIDDKKKKLWKHIFENAVTDRSLAFTMFQSLVKIVAQNSTEFAVHGKTLSSYLERMSKSNDQLIKLADLVARAEGANQNIDADQMFAQINKRRN